jgi:hypothetical protein
VDDVSFLYLSKYVPTGELIALKYTDLTLSSDHEFIDEMIVSESVPVTVYGFNSCGVC